MSDLQGWIYDEIRDTKPCIYAADISEGQPLAVSDATTSPMTVAVAGAGDVPVGVAPRTLDILEDGARGQMVFNGQAPILLAAAVTDATLPVMTAAAGTATPVTANNDVILGMPQTTKVISTIVLVDLKLMGSYYGA